MPLSISEINPDAARRCAEGAPFTVEIAVNGYHIKDVKGYVWAVCRDSDHARIVRDGLHELAKAWTPEPLKRNGDRKDA